MVAFSQMKTPLTVMAVMLASVATSMKTNAATCTKGVPAVQKYHRGLSPDLLKASESAGAHASRRSDVIHGGSGDIVKAKPKSPTEKETESWKDYLYLPGLNFLFQNEAAGKAFGITMSAGGIVWAMNKWAEEKSDVAPEGIGAGWGACFTLMLVIGAVFVTHHIFKGRSSIYGLYGSAITLSTLTAVCAGVSLYKLPVLPHEDFGLSIGMGVFGILCLILLVGAYVMRDNKVNGRIMKDQHFTLAGLSSVLGHVFGAASLLGGMGYFSYVWVEELGDTHVDSFGMEALGMWGAFTIGFFWIMREFITNNNQEGGLAISLQVLATFAISGGIAGCLIGGFECALLESHAAIPCFIGAAVLVGLVIAFRFFLDRMSCFKDLAGKFFRK